MLQKLLLICFSFAFLPSSGQNFQWAKTIGGSGDDYINAFVRDGAGNMYLTGYFNGTVDFDPSAAVVNLSSSGSSDVFITKFDVNGTLIWAKSIGGTTTDLANAIVLDASGNPVLTGYFSGTVDFNPETGVFNLIENSTGSDVFVLKLDTNGSFIWAKSFSGSGSDIGRAINISSSGDIYVAGVFAQTVDFDPGTSTFNLSATQVDGFICKLSALGDFIWAKPISGPYGENPYSITLDNQQNVYITGGFTGTVDFDPSTSTYPLSSYTLASDDIFILKLSSLGNFVWAKSIGAEYFDFGYSIASDASGNLYLTGTFYGTVDFDPSSSAFNLTGSGFGEIFVLKLDASGNFIWAKKMGGVGTDEGRGIFLDNAGTGIYVTGYFSGTADLDPSTSTYNLVSNGGADAFIAKLDHNGNFGWAVSIGGTGTDVGRNILADAAGSVYATGIFAGTTDLDPSASNSFNVTSNGNNDSYILKLVNIIVPIALKNFDVQKKGSNVLLAWQTASEINTNRFEIEKSKDGINFKKIGEAKAAGNTSSITSYQFVDFNAGLTSTFPIAYYRFKQIDLDDRFNYSPIKSIKFDDKYLQLQVYPNPATSSMTIQTNSVSNSSPFFITDITGKKVLQGNFNNSSSQTVNISSLPKGFYFVHTGNNEKETVKFEKQ